MNSRRVNKYKIIDNHITEVDYMKPMYVLLETEYVTILSELRSTQRRTIKSLVREGLEVLALKHGIIQRPVFEIRRQMGKV